MRVMKQKKKLKLIFLISLVIICFSNPIFARYYETLQSFSGKATIAEPIIKIENLQDTIKMEVNKESNIEEYNFIIKNYELEENQKRINEVYFEYSIEIKNTCENFPIRYELYDVESGEELLKGTNKISRIKNLEEYRV